VLKSSGYCVITLSHGGCIIVCVCGNVVPLTALSIHSSVAQTEFYWLCSFQNLIQINQCTLIFRYAFLDLHTPY